MFVVCEFWSSVSPSICGLMYMGSCVLYSAGCSVKRVHVALSGLRMRLFVCVHVCISCRCDGIYAFAMFMSLYVDVMVMSYTYALSCTGACGVGLSDMYILNNVGDKTPPCGT